MAPPRSELIRTYRHLYKNLLRAVQYSKPARFVVRDRIRIAFRLQSEADYDATRIGRTLEFLDTAAKTRGLEHKIVKNLMHVWWTQENQGGSHMRKENMELRKTAYRDFNHTIQMLDETMGLCVAAFASASRFPSG